MAPDKVVFFSGKMGENDSHNILVEKNKRLSSDLSELSDKPSNEPNIMNKPSNEPNIMNKPSNEPNIMNKTNLSASENKLLTEDQSRKTDDEEKVKNCDLIKENGLIVINVRSAETEEETTNNEDEKLIDEENVKVMIIDEKEDEKGEKQKTKEKQENTEDSGPRRTGRKRAFNYLNSEHQVRELQGYIFSRMMRIK